MTRRIPRNQLLDDPVPWLTTDSIMWLEKHLTPEMTGIEFGGGNSTIWFLQRLKRLYTFESRPFWAIKLLERLEKELNLIHKWRLIFVNCDWQIDDHGRRWYIHPPEMNKILTEKDMLLAEGDYCSVGVPQADFILVDGTIRYKSLKRALQLLNSGGILCVDNMEKDFRQRYVNSLIPSDWIKLEFPETDSEELKDIGKEGLITSIWIKK